MASLIWGSSIHVVDQEPPNFDVWEMDERHWPRAERQSGESVG